METIGLEPIDATALSDNLLRQRSSKKEYKKQSNDSERAELQRLLSIWPDLPEVARQEILTVIRHHCAMEVQS